MNYYGRKKLTTSATEIDESNVLSVINKVLADNVANVQDINYLYDYYRGKQAILSRKKTYRNDINNKVCENRAHQIVDFKTGYLVGEAIQYTSASGDEQSSSAVGLLNAYMRDNNKAALDKDLSDWQNICGTAFRMILPTTDDEHFAPFRVYTLDPRQCFIIYSKKFDSKALCGVYYAVGSDGTATYSVYTKNKYFEIIGDIYAASAIIKVENNALGIPIVEYALNMPRLGVFEPVLDLLDCLNTIQSNRIDGLEQFVQSLLIVYNAHLDDDMSAQKLRDLGLVELNTASGDAKADIKILSEELDQQQTEVLKQDIYQSILEIVGMPSQGNGNTSDSSNNGAMILKQGWQGAEARAKDAELMWKRAETEMLRLVLRITGALDGIYLMACDIEPHFKRHNYEDITSKANVLNLLLSNNKVAPIDAYTLCGMFTDPEDACRRGLEYARGQEDDKQVTD